MKKTEEDIFYEERRQRLERYDKNKQLTSASKAFLDQTVSAGYSYNFNWLGRPIIQYPQDIYAVQELIWKVNPTVVIETGVAHGGSLILSASMLALLDARDRRTREEDVGSARRRRVYGIDIEIRSHNRKHIEEHFLSDYITLFEGSSVSSEIVDTIITAIGQDDRVMVFLDSNHTHAHVLDELQLYAPMVSMGSYCVVFDTLIEHQPEGTYPNRPWGVGNNPATAVNEFVSRNADFVIDREMDAKLLVSVAKGGYLKRIG